MNCPGSITLLQSLSLPESDEPDYRREGTAMHHAAAHCLDNHLDAWEVVGQEFFATKITGEMGTAIQVYLDYVARYMTDEWRYYVEYGITSHIHELFYGTLDFGAVHRTRKVIRVVDLKGGEGILVEAVRNPQLMYYAYGLIEGLERELGHALDDATEVVLAIVQPRITWTDEPFREWPTTVGEIKDFIFGELMPAMQATEIDNTLDAGSHCRFCPAKLACPLLTGLFKAAAVANPKEVIHYNDFAMGRNYELTAAVKYYITAVEAETYRRLNQGHDIPQVKLVPKKANRVWSDKEGPKLAVERFGNDAMDPATIKSPAALEKVSPAAAAFVKEHAHTPNTGLTVALASDPRVAVKVKTSDEAFGAAISALTEGGD